MNRFLAGLVVLLGGYASSALAFSATELAALLLEAHDQDKKIPLVSESQMGLDLDRAYEVQREYVKRRLLNDRIAGFKAGLTSKPAQRRFAMDTPLAGVLLASGQHSNRAILSSSSFRQPMLEMEIGFVAGQTIAQPLQDVSQLRTKIRGFLPVIEVPDLGFADMKKLKGVDIIAANVSASQFIAGEEKTWDSTDVNKVVVALEQDGRVVNRGHGADAMGDQWEAALWLVNATVEHGWIIEAGSILITGALGKLIPAMPGKYAADYGTAGTLRFEIK